MKGHLYTIWKETYILYERKPVNSMQGTCILYERKPIYYKKGNLYTTWKETCILYERKPIYYMKGNLYTIWKETCVPIFSMNWLSNLGLEYLLDKDEFLGFNDFPGTVSVLFGSLLLFSVQFSSDTMTDWQTDWQTDR